MKTLLHRVVTLGKDAGKRRDLTRGRQSSCGRITAAMFALFAMPLCGPVANGWAQTDAAEGPAAKQDRPLLVPRELATGSYADRQRATLEMWRKRTLSRQAVQDAARNDDPEVAERAQWILRQWRSGILPDENEGGLPSHNGNGPAALAAVMDRGEFGAALVAVEESAGTIEWEQIKRRVARSLLERFPIYASAAIKNGTLPDLAALVNAVAIDREMAVTHWELQQHLGRPIDEESCLPEGAHNWIASERLICRSLFAALHDDPEQAISFAEQAGDPTISRMAMMILGRWEQLLQSERKSFNDAFDVQDRVEAAVWMLAAAYRCDDKAAFDEAKTFLVDSEDQEATGVNDLRWRILAMHDQVDEAIEVAALADKANAAKISVASSRFEQAILHSGCDPQEMSWKLDEWIDFALVDQQELSNKGIGRLAPSVERLYAFARMLIRMGQKDAAFHLYSRLKHRDLIVTPLGHSLLDMTLTELRWGKQIDWVAKLAVEPNDHSTRAPTRGVVEQALNVESETFAAVAGEVQQMFPRQPYYERFQMTFALLQGNVPDGFDAEADFERLFLGLCSARPTRGFSGRQIPLPSFALNEEILQMFAVHGHLELARQGELMLSNQGDLDAKIRLAEAAYREGQFDRSFNLWTEIAEQSTAITQVALDHGLAFAKSVVGRWLAAKRLGYVDQAGDLAMQIRLMAMSPSLKLRHELAEYLHDYEQNEIALEVLQDLVIENSYAGADAPDQFSVAVSYVSALSDLQEEDQQAFAASGLDAQDVVKWSDLAVLGILNDPYLERTFIAMPLSVRITKLQHAIETKDAGLAEAAIEQIEQFDPLNIDFGERLLPELSEAGLATIAEQALDRLMDRGIDYASSYPFDATALNNFAWAAAMNGKRLDDAMRLSRQAVLLEPDSVIFRDTLAEVLHRQGDDRQALAIESACLIDDPDDWHLHTQIEKYRELVESQTATKP
ncbi:hypothetical protein [Rhodopirellula sp. MGV]|uniref:hypothetical protein n=1 Tax=Rhodopirellula sp. MGV TaxID=2023130 RepID=UPI000BCA01B3|nr:hypothetical protein [Rhodopirellula sp. MGV]OYP34717.1 hypothetical protein CGZ80_13880 [Rhodopirellula sp. MGV]